jgi:hypothetical protein
MVRLEKVTDEITSYKSWIGQTRKLVLSTPPFRTPFTFIASETKARSFCPPKPAILSGLAPLTCHLFLFFFFFFCSFPFSLTALYSPATFFFSFFSFSFLSLFP